MFSLPTVASGMWFGWSLLCMALSWFCMYKCCLLILEVNLRYPRSASFDTIVKDTLGRFSNVINGALFAFVLYILDYAYISGGGSIVNHTLNALFGAAPPQMVSGVIFAVFFSSIIWISTRAVDRVVTVLIVGMLISFALAATNLSLTAEISRLFISRDAQGTPFAVFTFAALPYFLTALGCYGVVPSLYRYYGKQPRLIERSILIGSLFPVLIYLVWMAVTMGNLPREAFSEFLQMPVSIRLSFTSRAIGSFPIRCARRGRWGQKPTAIRPLASKRPRRLTRVCNTRWAASERLPPAKVALQHANADTPDIYRDFFACPVEFGAYEHFGRVYLSLNRCRFLQAHL